jgi:hypothetical protein
MSIPEIADQVESVVKLGDALGKSEQEIHDDVHGIVGHLPVDQIAAVQAHIVDSVARDSL